MLNHASRVGIEHGEVATAVFELRFGHRLAHVFGLTDRRQHHDLHSSCQKYALRIAFCRRRFHGLDRIDALGATPGDAQPNGGAKCRRHSPPLIVVETLCAFFDLARYIERYAHGFFTIKIVQNRQSARG